MTDVRKYLGCKYAPRGRDPKTGLDCYGLVICIFGDLGLRLPDPGYAGADLETNKKMLESLERAIPSVKLEKPERGCVIEFIVSGEPSHVGIYMGSGDFIHVSERSGVVVDKLRRWNKRVKGYYRVIK